jgi:hypothetical protein
VAGDLVAQVKAQIAAGRISFDSDAQRAQMLRENDGVKVTDKLLKLVIEVSKLQVIRVSSVVRNEGHHGRGRAFDVGNEAIAGVLLPAIATDAKVAELEIDEVIFDATVAGQSDPNHWNYDQGAKHAYNAATVAQHRNHIHFAVKD